MSDDPRDGTEFPPASDPYDGDETPPPPPGAPEPGTPESEPPVNLPPWEDRSRYGLVTGFLNTIPQVMTSPGRFFADHPVRHGLWGPVTFGVLIGVMSSVAEWMWSRVFSGFDQSLYAILGEEYAMTGREEAIAAFIQGFGVLLSPLMALIVLLLTAGLVHLGVMLLASDRNNGFEATLRATAYAGAASILSLVPVCGSGVGSIWALVIAIIGVRALHGMGTGRALVAVLAPLLIFCCGCGGLIGLFAGISSAL